MTRYQLQWGYCYGGGSIWWLIGMVAGAAAVAIGPCVLAVLEYVLPPILVAALLVMTPMGAVFGMRWQARERQAKKTVVKRRGPAYADYAYIL